ncbi:MAG: amidohydrolase, partial [Alteromonas sp.]
MKTPKRLTQVFGWAALFTALAFTANSYADGHQETPGNDYSEWDVLTPPLTLSSIDIETDETTWSSLDVSPNGEHFVFDMLGDIYIVDINGGEAKPLTQDFAWNIHPAISPDGTEVAFISDRDGLSNIWIMDIDGTNLRQVTKEKNNIIHSPKWSPDGQYLVGTKGIMSSRSIPAGEIWMWHKSGGSGLVIKARIHGKSDQKNIADPAFSPDGKYIYYTQDVTPGSTFSYNRDPLKAIFAITRFDRKTGEEERYISGTGGAIVPTPSPDGRSVAYVRRVTNRTALFIKDIETGIEEPIFLGLERDMQEGFGSEGYFAYFDWTPDSDNIVFWTGGKFHVIDVANSTPDNPQITTLNVNVKATLQYADALRFPVDVAPEEFGVKAIRWSQKSPDGKSVLFQALGKLYVRDLKSGKTKRLTRQDEHDEYYPRYSNDGKRIVYTTWNDQELGSIRVVSARGGKGKVVSLTPGHYIEPSFSTDGEFIAYRKFSGGYLLDPKHSVDSGIYILNLDDEVTKRVAKRGWNPHFAGDNSRLYYTESVGGTPYPETQFVSVDLNGEDKHVHLYGADKVSEYRLSHDKQWVAFVHQYNAYIAPFADNGKKITVGPTMTSLPVKQVSARAGEYLNWAPNSASVGWFHGPYFFDRQLSDTFAFLAGEDVELPEAEAEGINLSFTRATDNPDQITAIVGGKVVTMRNANEQQEVIENGVVQIEGNRITAVDTAAS